MNKNIILFEKVYEENKKLDDLFLEKYNHDEFTKKNKLELLVEIGELANETKCFKYWSKSKVNDELLGMEFADCIIMTLCFFHTLSINLNEEFPQVVESKKMVDTFIDLYQYASSFALKDDKKIIKKIFVTLLSLGYQLGYSDEKMTNLCLEKIACDRKRF